jgi:DNA primase large subunit
LWEFLQHYDENDKDGSSEGLDTNGNDLLKEILNDSFLMDYFVLDSISSSKKEQKEKLCKYAVVMINQQIQRVVSLLLNNGIKITDEEILSMVSNQIKDQKEKRSVDNTDVKKKFKNAMDEYLERINKY